jgi:pilus assembly protein Flp/PilA
MPVTERPAWGGRVKPTGNTPKEESTMLELFNRAFTALRNREEGQAMVEYALILGLVSVVSILALTAIGTNVNTIFESIRDALAGA